MRTFRRKRRTSVCGLVALTAIMLLPQLAHADVMLFDFNSLPANVNSRGGSDPIEAYMEGVYGSQITVRTGARTRRNRVNGTPADLYLGNSDAGMGHAPPLDTFLINRWNATSLAENRRDRITIVFEDEPITGLEFDWEIFPVSEDNRASIAVKADGEVIFMHKLFGADRALGKVGHFSLLNLGHSVRKLEFIDRSFGAPIGIDNLRVRTGPNDDLPVFSNPEPSSLVIAATGLLGMLAPVWRRWKVTVA